MIRTLLAALLTAIQLPFYLNWSREQAEKQIDKMLADAFDTPGAESPVTPAIVGGGVALLLVHLLGARLLRLRPWQALVSLLLGMAAGIGLHMMRPWERSE